MYLPTSPDLSDNGPGVVVQQTDWDSPTQPASSIDLVGDPPADDLSPSPDDLCPDDSFPAWMKAQK